MKIKEIKVFKSKGLVFAQFWSKLKIPLLAGQQPPELCSKYFYTELVKYLLTYLQKTWTAGQINLKFCVLSNQVMLIKTLENKKISIKPPGKTY